jgi:hypothetical protein
VPKCHTHTHTRHNLKSFQRRFPSSHFSLLTCVEKMAKSFGYLYLPPTHPSHNPHTFTTSSSHHIHTHTHPHRPPPCVQSLKVHKTSYGGRVVFLRSFSCITFPSTAHTPTHRKRGRGTPHRVRLKHGKQDTHLHTQLGARAALQGGRFVGVYAAVTV